MIRLAIPATLARISHQPSAAAAYLHALTSSRSVGDPRRAFGHASGRLGRIPRQGTQLRALATNAGEKSGLHSFSIRPLLRPRLRML